VLIHCITLLHSSAIPKQGRFWQQSIVSNLELYHWPSLRYSNMVHFELRQKAIFPLLLLVAERRYLGW